MLRTTLLQPSMALDRNEATRAKPVKGEEVVGKKNLQLSHPSVHTNYIWSASCLHTRWPSHASARSSHGFDQQASNVLWWTLTQQSSLHHRTLINAGVTDVMISYYKPSHSSAQSKAVLLTLTASVFPLTYVIHQSHTCIPIHHYSAKATSIKMSKRAPSHIHFVVASIRYT